MQPAKLVDWLHNNSSKEEMIMIFADKLIQLRKKSGWSQEDLANQMEVTRQSVSKWEAAQSIPDLDKIIKLSSLFGVSIDYLLKDEMEESGDTQSQMCTAEMSPLRRVSMEEASEYLSTKEMTAKTTAYAVFLCILSPVCLLVLGACSEVPGLHLTETVAGCVGMIVLLILVAVAVAVFVLNDSRMAPYEFLETEMFETEYGVSGMVKERKERYKNTYTRYNTIGVCICILSVIPLFGGAIVNESNELFMSFMLAAVLVLAGIGVLFFVRAGSVWSGFQSLLQEGDYTKQKKEKRPLTTAISKVYWLTATAIFFIYGFVVGEWGYSWIVWVLAGVLYPAVIAITNLFGRKK